MVNTLVNIINFAVSNYHNVPFRNIFNRQLYRRCYFRRKVFENEESLSGDHNVTYAREDLKPMTKFHSTGITPWEDFFFFFLINLDTLTLQREKRKGKSLWIRS